MAKEVNNKKEKKHFWKDFKAELKKVIWPTPKQVANNTTAVITIVLITAVLVFVLDLAFEKLNTQGIDRLRSAVTSKDVENDITVGDGNVIDNSVVDGNVIDNTTVDESVVEDNTVSE